MLIGAGGLVVAGRAVAVEAGAASFGGVDPHFELLAALARMAKMAHFGYGGNPAWNDAVDAHFSRFKHHVAVRRLANAQHRFRGDALASLATLLEGPVGSPALPVPLDPWPEALPPGLQRVDLPSWVREITDCARKSRFVDLWEALEPLRGPAERLAGSAATAFDLPWFEHWFGFPGPSLEVHASFGARGVNYAASRRGIRPAVTVYLGVCDEPSGLALRAVDTFLHQHITRRFVDPIMAEHRDVLQGPAERLHGALRERMESKGYYSWEAVLNEVVFRAVLVRYLREHGGAMRARLEVADQMEAGFPWTPVLVDSFAAYDADRARYPTFGDYAVDLAAVLSVIAEEESERAKSRPHILSCAPADDSKAVPPSTRTFVVTFDRKMHDKSWTIEVGDHFPQGENPRFDASGRVFTVDITLEPDESYVFMLNRRAPRGFQSAEGVPLDPVAIRFSTAPR